MRQIIKISLVGILLLPLTAFAHLISIAPVTSFPPIVGTSSTATANYRVTNISSRVPVIVVDESVFPNGLSISSSTCGALINPGQSCTIQLTYQAPSTPQTISAALQEWAKPSADGVRLPITINVKYTAIVGGQYSNIGGTPYPLLAQSLNGSNWFYAINSTTPTFPADFVRLGVGGFGFSAFSNHVAIAGGQYFNGAVSYPLLAQSVDNGSWSYVVSSSSPTLPADFSNAGAFQGTACKKDWCVAAGFYQNTGATIYPLLAQSTNNGGTWSYIVSSTTPALPGDFSSNGQFFGAACSDNLCVAGGSYQNSSAQVPLVAQSVDGGNSWSYVITSSSPTLPSNFNGGGQLPKIDCNGNICLAGGQYGDINSILYPLLAETTNAGASWRYVISSTLLPADFQTNGFFRGVSCGNSVCIAGGVYRSTNSIQYPLLAKSSDGGSSWSYSIFSSNPVLPADFSASGSINAVSCSNNICIAAGNYRSTNSKTYPLLALSSDSGVNWRYVISSSYPVLPTDFSNTGILNSANCTGQFCMAAGRYQGTSGNNYPLLLVTMDGGNNWSYNITSATPTLPSDFNTGEFDGSALPRLSLKHTILNYLKTK